MTPIIPPTPPAAPSGEAPAQTLVVIYVNEACAGISPVGQFFASERECNSVSVTSGAVRFVQWPEGFTPPQPPVAQPTASAREWDATGIATEVLTVLYNDFRFRKSVCSLLHEHRLAFRDKLAAAIEGKIRVSEVLADAVLASGKEEA